MLRTEYSKGKTFNNTPLHYPMFNDLFNHWLDDRKENLYQIGCRDRVAGNLPKLKDSAYLSGYFSERPEGLDGVMQFFATVDQYLQWKGRSLNT